MKLQVNLSGSWRNVVEFDADRAPEVEDAAASLARASDHQKFRVVDDNGTARYLTDRGAFRALHESRALESPISAGVDRTTSGAIGQP